MGCTVSKAFTPDEISVTCAMHYCIFISSQTVLHCTVPETSKTHIAIQV